MEQLRILIVDDEEDFAATLAERLTLRGFQVEAASQRGRCAETRREDGFSILILDVKMPGIGGLQLLSQIKATHPDLPIILLTGHGSVADAERGMEEGAFDYLMKPVDIDDLIEKIEKRRRCQERSSMTSEELQRRLRQEELAFFGRIGADVSHEMRNVLSIIGEHAGLLDDLLAMAARRKPLDGERLKKIAASITRQVKKGTEILDRFSRFAHATDEPTASFDLTALTGNMASLAQRRVTLAGRELIAELPAEAIPIAADSFGVQYALFSAVGLILESVEVGEVVTIKLVCQGPRAAISVAGKAAAGDGGLSGRLASLSTVVDELGGSVDASSADGTATVTIIIPVE